MRLIEQITDLFRAKIKSDVKDVYQLPGAGSARKYFRIYDKTGNSCIAAFNPDIDENETFFYYSEILKKNNINVPELIAVSDDRKIYIISDLGNTDLLTLLQNNRKSNGEIPENILRLYKKSLAQLAKLQIFADKDIDYSKAFSISEFDKTSILFDLNYFKYYFLNINKIDYDELKLQKDFEKLADQLNSVDNKFFMFRDFQARNIMIFNDEPYFIDYQGGRRGAVHYDAASLIFQAKAEIPDNLKNELIEHYINELGNYININKKRFRDEFFRFAFLRVLQTLGAYGNRGLIEGKKHFIESIPGAVKSLEKLINENEIVEGLPELKKACEKIIERQKEKGQQALPEILTIKINSFSYNKKIPSDDSGHGGGFVFDCRGIHNPGRYPQYKDKTGLDAEVIDFFEKNTKIDSFVNDVLKLIEYNIQSYLDRDFRSLTINFGCTGGQHRSVYCAEKVSKILKEKYPVKILLHHIEQNIYKEL